MRHSEDMLHVHRFTLAVLCGLMLLSLPGCSGCSKSAPTAAELEEQQKKREELAKKKPKPDFEEPKMFALPRDDTDNRVVVKPGHWTNTLHELKANNFDFKGNLSLANLNGRLDPIYLTKTPYTMTSSRPIVLPKGQTRIIESTQFVSTIPSAAASKAIQIESRIVAQGGRERLKTIEPTTRLQPSQYFFVVLSRSPESHGHLKHRASIVPPRENWAAMGMQGDYYMAYYSAHQEVALPAHALAWTSTAYVIWDDVEPDVLSITQQQALLDWLHWGGQLIINGHQSLDLLRGSFLEPYLPASAGPTSNMSQETMATLNECWTPGDLQNADQRVRQLPVHADKPPQVLELTLTEDSIFVPESADMVAERRVGRGRIAVTAFSLTDREMIDWGHFDNFLNGCLLRRPARRFFTQEGMPNVRMANNNEDRLLGSALINCRLRYFCRDATASLLSKQVDTRRRMQGQKDDQSQYLPRGSSDDVEVDEEKLRKAENFEWNLDASARPYGGFSDNRKQGVAGWTDFSRACSAARDSLTKAAGIEVPSRQFVLKALGVYLLCLVPLNWTLFRLMGRVEWAWFAAPIIAMAGAMGVVKSADLELGYVRSRTEIAVMELQPNYDRMHVTRFSALYTSLTSKYDVSFEGEDALVLPFSADINLRNATRRKVSYRRAEGTSLTGYTVNSSTTGMVRSEAVMPSPSGIVFEGDTDEGSIQNLTGVDWRAGVVLSRAQGQVRMALIDEVVQGGNVEVTLEHYASDGAFKQHLESLGYTQEAPDEGEATLRPLIQLATNTEGLAEGDIRLIAWTDQEVTGVTVTPSAPQQVFRTLIVGSLRYGLLPKPQSDANVLAKSDLNF